jgi:hypothetical protein
MYATPQRIFTPVARLSLPERAVNPPSLTQAEVRAWEIGEALDEALLHLARLQNALEDLCYAAGRKTTLHHLGKTGLIRKVSRLEALEWLQEDLEDWLSELNQED